MLSIKKSVNSPALPPTSNIIPPSKFNILGSLDLKNNLFSSCGIRKIKYEKVKRKQISEYE